jgi:hypothetical protein
MLGVENKFIMLSIIMLNVVMLSKKQATKRTNLRLAFRLRMECNKTSLFEKVNNGTQRFKNVNNCLNDNIYSYLETYGDQSSNLYLNVVNFINTSLI